MVGSDEGRSSESGRDREIERKRRDKTGRHYGFCGTKRMFYGKVQSESISPCCDSELYNSIMALRASSVCAAE